MSTSEHHNKCEQQTLRTYFKEETICSGGSSKVTAHAVESFANAPEDSPAELTLKEVQNC